MSWSYILHRYERDSSLFHSLPTKRTYANNLLHVSWQKWRHIPSCACGPFFCFEVGFYLFSHSWIIKGNERKVATHQRKIKRRKELPFSATTIIHLFFFSSVLFLSLFLLLRIREYPSINQRFLEPRGMCYSHIRMLIFQIMHVLCFFFGSCCV